MEITNRQSLADEEIKFQQILMVGHVTEMFGPVQALSNFLRGRITTFGLITHPFPDCSISESHGSVFEAGSTTTMTRIRRARGPPDLLYHLIDAVLTLRIAIGFRRRFQLCLALDNLSGFVGFFLRSLGVAQRVVYYSLEYSPRRFGNPVMNAVYHLMNRICMRKSDLVWSISAKIDELVKSYRLTGSKSLIVPNVVELDSISHASEAHIMRKTLVIASHLTESKGIQLAIEAMGSIIDEIPDAKLLIVGSGPYQSTLKEITSRKQLEHCVEFLGVMSHQDLSTLLPRCGIGLAPYTNDPNNITVYADPTKLKEYLASGLPVITTSAPAFAEVIRKNECGVVVNYEKSELAEAAVRLLSDDLLFWSCKKRAIALGSEFDSKRVYKKAFDDSYTSLAEARQVWHVSALDDTQYSTQRRIFDREYDQLGGYQLENWRISYLVRIFSSLGIQGNLETPDDRFLDVGVGGTGYTVIEAAKNGLYSVGTDLSRVGMQKAHSFAKRILGTRGTELFAFVTCSAEYLPFRDQSFTKLCCIAVLEHVPHDQTAILEISRTTRAGGRVFVSVPNAYDQISPIFHFAYKHFIDEKVGHLRHYDADHLGSELNNNGFDVRETYTHANFPKILQHLLTLIFPTLRKRTSRVWWALENIDFRLGGLNSGLNLSICAEKMS